MALGSTLIEEDRARASDRPVSARDGTEATTGVPT